MGKGRKGKYQQPELRFVLGSYTECGPCGHKWKMWLKIPNPEWKETFRFFANYCLFLPSFAVFCQFLLILNF